MPDNTPFTGLYPVYENQFKVAAPGGSTKTTIAEMESFGVAFNNGTQEWSPFEAEGWLKRMLTAKNVVITVSGKRKVGDTGNDLIAGKAFATGTNAEVDFDWTFPEVRSYPLPTPSSTLRPAAAATAQMSDRSNLRFSPMASLQSHCRHKEEIK